MLMKMAAASTTSLLLLCCFAISRTDSQDPCDYNALKGKDFIVPLSLKLEPSHRLKWKHNDNFIFDQRQGKVLFKRKEDDVSENGSLKLTNLNDRHKGIYTPELFNQDGNVIENRKSIRLCIFGPAPKPKVTKVCSSADVTFTCGVQAEAKDLKFAWLQNDKDLKEYTKTLKRNAEQVEKDSFRCKVFNPASSETSDAVTQEPCYKRKSIFPEKLLGISTWIYVGAGGGIVLVLVIVVIICCVRAKRKKRMLLKEEGELRLQWTNEQQHPHHHPHHHQHQHQQHQHNHPPEPHHHRSQQQPAGHTGPRQHRSKQHREQHQLPRVPPEPSSRRPPQAPRAVDQIDDEQPPPLPQPRKKAAKTPRV
ncbi:T-cell surface antigen CD2 isoform X2 [Etheostoma spectabile]|uniref:T-cell surface antigen CD2 isoform X2 n=1 Tax=Etheostoma spectabile TaxID=54343 RepID=UPI0013AF92E8|nr:T-cell surface antigen CD2-like isoform X2 [Etheostoma spectabile]